MSRITRSESKPLELQPRRIIEVARCCGSHYHRWKAAAGRRSLAQQVCVHCRKALKYRLGPGRTRPWYRDTVEQDLPSNGAEKTQRIDLGLALLSAVSAPGAQYTQQEIAAWCGCSRGRIFQIEQKALRRLRCILQKESGRHNATTAQFLLEALAQINQPRTNAWDRVVASMEAA